MTLFLMASSVGLWFWLAPAGCIASHAASLARSAVKCTSNPAMVELDGGLGNGGLGGLGGLGGTGSIKGLFVKSRFPVFARTWMMPSRVMR